MKNRLIARVLNFLFVFLLSIQQSTAQEKALIRVVVDDSGKTPGSITTAELRGWAIKNGVAQLVPANNFGNIQNFIDKNVSAKSSIAIEEVKRMNYFPGGDINEKVIKEFDEKVPIALAVPIGAGKNISSVKSPSSRKGMNFLSYSSAAREGIARAIEDSNDVVVMGLNDTSRISTKMTYLVSAVVAKNIGEDFGNILISDSPFADVKEGEKFALQMEVSKDAISSLQEISGVRYEGLNVRMRLSLESIEQQQVSVKPLEPKTEKLLRDLFSKQAPPAKKALLIIVDDSWPSDEAFRNAKNFIGKNMPEMWPVSTDILPSPKLSDEVVRLASPGPPKGYGCVELSKCFTHAKRIAMAIEPFERISQATLGTNSVETLYVPLTKAQDGSEDFLRSIWRLGYAFGDSQSEQSNNFFNKGNINEMKRREEEFVASLPKKLSGADVSFDSNWAILTGVFRMARFYSKSMGVPVFVNLSWTSEDENFNPPGLTEWNTLAVAAAGNYCGDNGCDKFSDDVAPRRNFIKRAANLNDVILVTNLDSSGKYTCNSSRIRKEYNVVGFDGSLNGDCGTSFAAPRVAWLLAAKESFSKTPNQGGMTGQSVYRAWIVNKARTSACLDGNDFSCTMLSIEKLFSGVRAIK